LVQHLTAATHLESNVFFNGPHAAVSFNDGFGGGEEVVGNLMFNFDRQTCCHGVINVWERMPFIGDATNGGLVRNFTKAKYNTTDEMPSLELLRAGFTPGFDTMLTTEPLHHIGTVISPFRRIHRNFLLANYNAVSSVLLDDAGSRMLVYDNYMVYGLWGVGESCHNSQWVYGVGNIYGYTSSANPAGLRALLASEGPSPTGIRTFFYENVFLNMLDSDWCNCPENWQNLTQFWSNEVHSPGGKAGRPDLCHGGNNTLHTPLTPAAATQRASSILAPYPMAAAVPPH